MNGYRDIHLPFESISDPPSFAIRMEWTLEQLLNFLQTWSAVKRFATAVGSDPMEGLGSKLLAAWGAPDQAKVVHMPLAFKASRKPA